VYRFQNPSVSFPDISLGGTGRYIRPESSLSLPGDVAERAEVGGESGANSEMNHRRPCANPIMTGPTIPARVVAVTEPRPKYTKRQRQLARYAYRLLGMAAALLLIGGTVVFHYLEGWSWVDAFYFSAVAGTTVGFGDLAPTTDLSKLVSVVYIFAGIGILGTFLDQRLRYHGVVKNKTEKAISKSREEPPT
jgi:hypothetical protein